MAVGTPTTNSTSGSTFVVAVPAGAASGQIALFFVSVDNVSSNIVFPAGFTELDDRSLTSDGQRVATGWKRLSAADSGNYTATDSGSTGGNYAAACVLLTGRHATNPPVIGTITADNNANTGTSLTETATGLTAVAGDDILHVSMEDVAAVNIGNGHSAWSLGTGIIDVIDGGGVGAGWANIGVAKSENVAAGATGNKTVTFSKSPSGNNGFVTYLIRVPAAPGGAVSFNMGTTQAILTLAGIVAQARALVSPPVAVQTWTAQAPTKLIVKEPFSPVATINLVGIVGTVPSSPVSFNMGTTQAIMNLTGIVPTKLSIRANSASALLTFTANAPTDKVFAHPIIAPVNLSATVPSPRVRSAVMPISSLALSAQVPSRPIVKVAADVAILRFVQIAPIDPTTNPNKPQKIRALGLGNVSDSKDTLSR